MIRKYFLTFFTSIMALSCGLVCPVYSAEINYPSAGWTVGPIFAKGDNGVNYCSMKNVYQSGQTLVFARDGNGSNSIGLDFQKPVMEAGRQYAVTMSVGAVMRRVTAVAATPQVMIMQMGDGGSFYNAIRNGERISFAVGKTEYVFGLTGTSEALTALGECSKSFNLGGKFAQVTFPFKREKTKENIAVVEKKKVAVVEKKHTPKKAVPKKAEDADQEPDISGVVLEDADQTEIDRLRTENKKISSAPQESQAEIKAELLHLKEKNKNLALLSEASRIEIQKKALADQDRVRGELSVLKEENRKLAEANAAMQKDSQDVIMTSRAQQEEIKAEIARLKEESRSEILRLKAENQNLSATAQNRQKEIEAEVARLKEENAGLGEMAKAAQKEKEKWALESQIGQERIKAEIARTREENRKITEAVSARKKEIEAATAHLREENEKLAAQIGKNEVTVPKEAANPSLPSSSPAPLPLVNKQEKKSGMLDVIRQILISSNITDGKGNSTKDGAYHWESEDLYGSLQEIAWIPGKTVREMAGDYIGQAGARCGGNFEQSLGNVKMTGDFIVVEAEIACIDGQDDAAAALLFIADSNGKLSVLTQEGAAEQMPEAIRKRELVVSAAAGGA